MTDNAFERPPHHNDDAHVPLFELIQRALPEDGVDDAVASALKELPPDAMTVTGIEQNIDKLKQEGLWATARFYEKLLALRGRQEG